MSPESPGAELGLRNLTKVYDDNPVVKDVSLTVEPGEFVTFLGPSGSGKTTTLNMIAGFTELTAGEVVLDGRQIAGLPPHKRGIGVVFQQYALFPHLTVFDNVSFPLRQRRVSKAEIRKRVTAVLEQVQLGQFRDRYPAQLSGGQQQRVAVARAIAFNPRLLLMDEPLGALDKKLRESLQFEIRTLHRDVGITFVYVTHDQDEALAMSDRIAVFNRGVIEQVGTPKQLYEMPATVFVAQFLGESNFFDGRVVRDGDGVTVESDGMRLRTAVQVSDCPPGDCRLMVRPERLHVLAPGRAIEEGHNVVSGTIVQSVYLGSTRRVEVVVPGGRRLIVREEARTPSSGAEGDEVLVTWPVSDSLLLPDLGSTSNGNGSAPA